MEYPKYEGHEYVDLGLSVDWALCNVGAATVDDYGDYFAWGETSPKEKYTRDNSIMMDNNWVHAGSDPAYDVARATWGGTWRLPTTGEMKELMNNCRWCEKEGGYEVISKVNGAAIFLPACGQADGKKKRYEGSHGYYWTGDYHDWDGESYFLMFGDGDIGPDHGARMIGMCVRPVCHKVTEEGKAAFKASLSHETVDLGLSVRWGTCNVGSRVPSGEGINHPYYRKKGTDGKKGDEMIKRLLGEGWRLPTFEEFEELFEKCRCEYTFHRGIGGLKFTADNGAHIFLPLDEGYGSYCATEPGEPAEHSDYEVPFSVTIGHVRRYVRAVHP